MCHPGPRGARAPFPHSVYVDYLTCGGQLTEREFNRYYDEYDIMKEILPRISPVSSPIPQPDKPVSNLSAALATDRLHEEQIEEYSNFLQSFQSEEEFVSRLAHLKHDLLLDQEDNWHCRKITTNPEDYVCHIIHITGDELLWILG